MPKSSITLVCLSASCFSSDVQLSPGPSLKVVSTLSVGYDHVDTKELFKRGVRLGNTPGVLTNATVCSVMSDAVVSLSDDVG